MVIRKSVLAGCEQDIEQVEINASALGHYDIIENVAMHEAFRVPVCARQVVQEQSLMRQN